MTFIRTTSRILIPAALLLSGFWSFASAGTDDLDVLRRMRAERREASRERHAGGDKDGSLGLFGLLVIPVDFADARLAPEWDPTSLSPRLTAPTGESLVHYFSVASRGRVDLRITLAPPVSLPGSRRDYSDRDLQGFTRTRALATESLEALKDLGLEFRRLDMDGPDLVPGSGDDDGQVDGVLILHAAPGEENDPTAGLIQPLQFYLDEPVVSDGVAASFYAVASLQSGPGIWAHETAHLLGLEDRYDPLRPSAGGEVSSLGGLGRFSLMSSGAWGTGNGWGAALPDAYSRAQMGWIRVEDVPPSTAGPLHLDQWAVARVWSRSEIGDEFFMLETRDPIASAPFDAMLPRNHLVITHVDETVPEAGWSDDGLGEYHLRVRLVEADGDSGLQDGLDDGGPSDLFPGTLGKSEFTPASSPASDGYLGPTTVALTGITTSDDGVSFTASTSTVSAVDVTASFLSEGEGVYRLSVEARETGPELAYLGARVLVDSDPAWGSFAAGNESGFIDLARDADGVWSSTGDVFWTASAGVPDGVSTDFAIVVTGSGFFPDPFPWTWVWGHNDPALDFANAWPGEWVVEHPTDNPGTTWHRWAAAPFLTADGLPVLACVDAGYPTSAAWPSVMYGNGAYAILTSGPIGSDVRAVSIVHAIETEILNALEAADGGRMTWVAEDGSTVPAVPVDGYPGAISTRVQNPLHGEPAFAQDPLVLDGDVPLWRRDVVLVPTDPGGPWRLRFEFGSNGLWRRKGWFIADLQALEDTPQSAVPLVWNGNLSWDWPFGSGAQVFQVSYLAEDGDEWKSLWSGTVAPETGTGTYELDGGVVLDGLPGSPRRRNRVKVAGPSPQGTVASRGITIYEDGGDGATILLSRPWPNPGRAPIRFQIDVPLAREGNVSIFDLRGRLVRRLDYPAGSHLGIWDGKDSGGRQAPSGTYFLRLEGSGPVTTRKVVLLH